MKFFISRIDDNRKASEIFQEVDVLKAISCIKAAWQEVSDQTVSTWFPKCGFRNKAQDGVVQTLDQDEDEEFANLVKELAGDVDPDDFVNFDKDNSSSMPAVDASSFSWRQEIWKQIIEKYENPAEEVMDASSNEEIDEEIKDPERIQSIFDALQVMAKVIQFSHQFDSEELRESIVKIIEGLQDLQIWWRRQTKITTFFTKK